MEKNFNQTKVFIDQLEASEIIEKSDIASLEGLPTPEDVFEALLLRGISDIKLSQAYARFRGVPFIEINEISQQAKDIIDGSLSRKFGFVPFYIASNILQVAITDPRKLVALNEHSLKKLSHKLGYKIEILFAAKSQTDKAILEPKVSNEKVAQINNQVPTEVSKIRSYDNPVTIDLIKSLVSEGDAGSLVLALIKFAHDKRADEFTIEPFEKTIAVKLKIDGKVHNLINLPSVLLDKMMDQLRMIASLVKDENFAGEHAKFELALGKERPHLISLDVIPTLFGERAHLRFMVSSAQIPSLGRLGLFEKMQNSLEDTLAEGYGMILMGGLNSSGKSTTLYSLLNYLASKGKDAIAIERDSHYNLELVSQVEIKPEIGFGYAESFRSAQRQNPDVIMIDSLSDSETAKLTLHSAISGSQILSGIYAREAAEALVQYNALCQEPFLVSSAVKLIICQNLVRKICSECRTEIRVSDETLSRVQRQLGTTKDLRFYKGVGCDRCKNGYRGRLAIFELLEPTSEIMDLLASGASKLEIHKAAINSGMITMRQDGLLKAVSGLTTVDEVIKATRPVEG